jgi:aminopeptidase N
MAAKMQDALSPDANAWKTFHLRNKPPAYAVDATTGTTPVWQELANLDQAKSNYGPIVYNKAPAVLRELHERLGAALFREGLKRFLVEHAFGNADWRDLAKALEAAARRDLGAWSERWLLAPSMPQVRVEWTTAADGTVESASVTQRAIGGDGTWPLDLELLVFDADGERRTLSVLGDSARLEISDLVGTPAPAAILANPRDVAYGQFVPDDASREWLLQYAPGIDDPLIRAVAVQALFEAVREAELDPAAFVAMVITLVANERDPDTHGWLLDMLSTCLGRYLTGERRDDLRRQTTRTLLEQLRSEAASGRELQTLRFLARTDGGDPQVAALCRAVVEDGELPPGLEPGKQDRFLAAASLLAAGQDRDDIAALQRRFDKEDVGKEVFLARAATPTAEVKADYWRLYNQLDEPPEQWMQDSLTWFHWQGQEALTLPYLERALAKVGWVKQHRRIFFMPAWIDAFVNGHDSAEALAIVDGFLEKADIEPDVRKKLMQSRDGLWRAVHIRAAFGAAPK